MSGLKKMGTEKTAQRRAVHQPIDKPKLELMLSVLTCEKQTPADIDISAGRLWNKAPIEIKEAINMSTAKRLIKAYSRKMPI